MRSEELERLRRTLHLAHGVGAPAPFGRTFKFKPVAPWDAVFTISTHPSCLEAQAFWAREVKDKAVLCLARATSAPVPRTGLPRADDPEPAVAASGPGRGRAGPDRKPNPRRSRQTAKQQRAQAPPAAHTPQTPRPGRANLTPASDVMSAQICWGYNSGSCSSPCPTGRKHSCSTCGAPGHPAYSCTTGGGAGKGKGNGKKRQREPYQ